MKRRVARGRRKCEHLKFVSRLQGKGTGGQHLFTESVNAADADGDKGSDQTLTQNVRVRSAVRAFNVCVRDGCARSVVADGLGNRGIARIRSQLAFGAFGQRPFNGNVVALHSAESTRNSN